MNLVQGFRSIVVLGVVTYLAYWLLPYTYGYLDPDVGSLLSYSGFNALLTLPSAFDYGLLAAWIVVAVGLCALRKVARVGFLALIAVATALSPLYGISVETAAGHTLLSITHMADGAVLALAYFSPVRHEFY